MNPEKPTKPDANRRYNAEVRDFVAGGKVEPAARSAGSYVEQKPQEAARAEREARGGPKPTWLSLDELMAQGRTVVDRVRPIAERAIARLRARLDRK